MRKKALRKDFYMEIRKSVGRFLSIFFIVAIGTAFFSGIRAAEPDMRLSGDVYFDQSKLMDLQVISTMGLTADDLQAIREIKGVEQAQPVYSMDALCDVDGSQKVVHIFSFQDGINELKAEKGRMPEKADECVADADFLASSGYQIGDKITFLKDEDTEVTEELTQSTFQIVGSVSSPEYISFSRGSSMIGNGSVSGFVSVLPESFQMDAYTEISIQVKGAKEETAFTKEYDNLVDETKKKVEAIQSEREDIRREELMQQMDQKQAELLAEVPPEAMEIAAPQIQQQIEQQKTSLEQGKWYVNGRVQWLRRECRPNAGHRESISCFILFSCGVDQSDFYDAYGGRAEDSDRNTQSAGIFQALHCRKIFGICILGDSGRLCVRCAGWRKNPSLYHCDSLWNYVSSYEYGCDPI